MAFDTYYPQNIWEGITTKERAWYVPNLYNVYKRAAIYNRFVRVQHNFNGPRATQMYIDSPILPHANHDTLGLRALWTNAAHMDFFRRTITFNRYGGKFSLNRYDD